MRHLLLISFRLLMVILIVWIFSCPVMAKDFQSPTSINGPRVLILYSFNYNLPSQQQFSNGLETAREKHNMPSGSIVHEYLDIVSPDNARQRPFIRQLLLNKYSGIRFDLIVTIYEEALDFLLNEGKDISPDSPCFAVFANERPSLKRGNRKVIQFPLEYDLLGTLELGLRFFPDTRNVKLITGTGKSDRLFEQKARIDLEAWKGKLNIDFTSSRSIDEVVSEVRALPEDTIVICSRVTSDVTGKACIPKDVVRKIAAASNSPVFCLVSAQIDTGAIGGSVIDFGETGALLGRSVVNIVNGQNVAFDAVSQYRPMFNWEQMRRWSIDPVYLPKDSRIINQPMTLWGQYKKEVIGTVVIVFSLMTFILILIIQNRRRARAERKARLLQDHFRLLIDKAPDAIMVYDDGIRQFIDANESAEKLFGMRRVDLIQFGPERFYPKNQPDFQIAGERFQKLVKKTFEGAEPQFELAVQTNDGRDLFCEVHLVQLPSEEKRLIRASFIDITARKKSDEMLSREKERYRTILQTAMDGYLLIDSSGRILEVNESYAQMVGYSTEELCTMRISDVDEKRTPGEVEIEFHDIMKIGSTRFDTRHRRKDGKIIDVEVSVMYQGLDGGRCVAFIRDITERMKAKKERKNLENQLQQAQKMEILGTLAGGIAHDFNNILYPIMGFTEIMIDMVPEESELRFSLNQILKASLRASDLIQQILMFSRQSDIERMPLKMQLVIKETLKLVSAILPSTITIESHIDNHCGMVLANPTHIHQIAMNLMTNAFHAMEEDGGVLSVSLTDVNLSLEKVEGTNLMPGNYILFSVKDTGYGIEKNNLEKIFDPYFTTKDVGKGTGLGLSVVQGIVRSYNGDVTVKSEPGKGSVFEIYLPVIDTETPDISMNEADLDQYRGHEHILVVDDEKPILNMIRKTLERRGYRVSILQGSLEALDVFKASPGDFDLVITDMTMPVMTGEKLAREMKQIHVDIPVILCSGFNAKIPKGHPEAIGVDGFLMKPVVKNVLLKTIRSLLDR